MLGSGRVKQSCLGVGDGSAIAEGPNVGPVTDFKVLVHDDTPAIFLAGQVLKKRIRRRARSPDESVGVNHGAVTQLDASIGNSGNFRVDADFYFSLGKLALRIPSKFFSQLRQDYCARVD